MESIPVITEADILSEVVAASGDSLSREMAESILQLGFAEKATLRIQELLEKNNSGTIEPGERAELDRYLRVGQFLDLWRAKASLLLQQHHAD